MGREARAPTSWIRAQVATLLAVAVLAGIVWLMVPTADSQVRDTEFLSLSQVVPQEGSPFTPVVFSIPPDVWETSSWEFMRVETPERRVSLMVDPRSHRVVAKAYERILMILQEELTADGIVCHVELVVAPPEVGDADGR